MSVVDTFKAKNTLRFWKASLAWKNIDDWAKGWTTESFINELRELCCDNDNMGRQADDLLHEMIHGRERRQTEGSAIVYHLGQELEVVYIDSLTTMTNILSQAN